MKIIAIYTRKSKSTDKGESIETQIKLCQEYIERIFINEKIETLLYDEGEGYSGGDSTRKKFNELLRDAKNKKFDVIICYRLDRIARSVADFSDLIEELNSNGISFVSVKEQFDTSTAMGRAMMYISSVFAQLEREIGAERIKDNLRELAKTGRWLGGTTPTGYKSTDYKMIKIREVDENNKIVKKIKKAHMLQEIEKEKTVIKIIAQKYLELKSLTALETFTIKNNMYTKNGKFFSRFALRNILENPVYAINDIDMYNYFMENKVDIFAKKEDFDGKKAIMAYNKTMQRKHKATIKNDMKDWIIAIRNA